MKTLVLWDIDHTLIENGGVSKETYAAAYEILTGASPKHRPQTDGRTDPAIMRDLFASHNTDFTGSDDKDLFPALIQAMRANRDALATRGYPLPGAEEVLRALQADASIVQSVLTGNIVENAMAKLQPFGLHKYVDFDVGGYVSDESDRERLVPVAQRRASKKYGCDFSRDSTVLVGDTPRDVSAAVDGGAQVIAVATGIYTEDTLRDAGADATLPELTDLDSFLRALAALSRSHAGDADALNLRSSSPPQSIGGTRDCRP
ncbi:MAG: HAD family hydrolase [Micromonosporaceae bacterium]